MQCSKEQTLLELIQELIQLLAFPKRAVPIVKGNYKKGIPCVNMFNRSCHLTKYSKISRELIYHQIIFILQKQPINGLSVTQQGLLEIRKCLPS